MTIAKEAIKETREEQATEENINIGRKAKARERETLIEHGKNRHKRTIQEKNNETKQQQGKKGK